MCSVEHLVLMCTGEPSQAALQQLSDFCFVWGEEFE